MCYCSRKIQLGWRGTPRSDPNQACEMVEIPQELLDFRLASRTAVDSGTFGVSCRARQRKSAGRMRLPTEESMLILWGDRTSNRFATGTSRTDPGFRYRIGDIFSQHRINILIFEWGWCSQDHRQWSGNDPCPL